MITSATRVISVLATASFRHPVDGMMKPERTRWSHEHDNTSTQHQIDTGESSIRGTDDVAVAAQKRGERTTTRPGTCATMRGRGWTRGIMSIGIPATGRHAELLTGLRSHLFLEVSGFVRGLVKRQSLNSGPSRKSSLPTHRNVRNGTEDVKACTRPTVCPEMNRVLKVGAAPMLLATFRQCKGMFNSQKTCVWHTSFGRPSTLSDTYVSNEGWTVFR